MELNRTNSHVNSPFLCFVSQETAATTSDPLAHAQANDIWKASGYVGMLAIWVCRHAAKGMKWCGWVGCYNYMLLNLQWVCG